MKENSKVGRVLLIGDNNGGVTVNEKECLTGKKGITSFTPYAKGEVITIAKFVPN